MISGFRIEKSSDLHQILLELGLNRFYWIESEQIKEKLFEKIMINSNDHSIKWEGCVNSQKELQIILDIEIFIIQIEKLVLKFNEI